MKLVFCGLLGAAFGSGLCLLVPGHPLLMGIAGGMAGAVVVIVVGDAYARR